MKGFADLSSLDEDRRIDVIGAAVMEGRWSSPNRPQVIGVAVETTEKADRYVRKLKEKFPGIRVIDQQPGPVDGTVLIRLGPPLN